MKLLWDASVAAGAALQNLKFYLLNQTKATSIYGEIRQLPAQWVSKHLRNSLLFFFSAAKNTAVEAQYSGIAHAKSRAVFGTAGKKETENNHPHQNLYQVTALCSEKILVFLLKLYGQALTVISIIQGYRSIPAIKMQLIQKETSYLLRISMHNFSLDLFHTNT